MAAKVKGIYEKVFRHKEMSPTQPKIGLPASVQPGDWLNFFLHGAYYGRYVASMHNGYCITEPLGGSSGQMDKSYKVKFGDFYDATRRTGDAEPEDEPEVEDEVEPEVEPEVEEPKVKAKRLKKPPVDFLEFLDDRYKDG